MILDFFKFFANQKEMFEKIKALEYIKQETDTPRQDIKQIKAEVSFAYTAGGTDIEEIKSRLATAQRSFECNGVIEKQNGSAIIQNLLPKL